MSAPPGEPLHVHPSDDEFLDLVSGLLDAPERERVVAHASACARCDARFREVAVTHERGLARAASELEASGARVAPWRVFGLPPGVLALAASVAIVAVLALSSRPRVRHPEPVWLPATTLEGERRDGLASSAESLVVAGVRAYEHRDLAEAERLLSEPLPAGGTEWLRRLYLGSTFVAQGRDSAAIGVLDAPYADLVPEPWNAEWGWAFYVALERRGLQARADSVLDQLVRRDDAVGERARAAGRPESAPLTGRGVVR